jgi:hypothetical protein
MRHKKPWEDERERMRVRRRKIYEGEEVLKEGKYTKMRLKRIQKSKRKMLMLQLSPHACYSENN